MKTTITKEQITTLATYEDYFDKAINSRWAPYPGQDAVVTMTEIYNAVTGTQRRINGSCATCILHLLQDVGKIYFAAKPVEKTRRATKKKS